MKNFQYIFIILLLIPFSLQAQDFKKHCISGEEEKLYNLINDYRKEQNLPEIKLSKSLSYVAKAHCIQLADSIQELTHAWLQCDYRTYDASTYACMWEKPMELTNYTGYGYENAFVVYGDNATAEKALAGWKSSKFHNDVILNKNMWKDLNWKAIGIGIYKNFATVWFGEEKDIEGNPVLCN
ncbi:MAG: CAP domain-containing protein [Marinilabiliales bacterium]|nr:MAG: CAP domain-containing protein [Marinilabiliales bacterium]